MRSDEIKKADEREKKDFKKLARKLNMKYLNWNEF
jgi:hypothetical protein